MSSTDVLTPKVIRRRARESSREDLPLADDIALQLEEDILRGRLQPGHRLDERELSERYGVSRTPIREALQRLSAHGLAIARGRQGLQVAQLSVAELLDALRVVAELEALAASQAALRITTAQRQALEAAHKACGRSIARRDHNGFYDDNIDFHDAIAAASHNPILQDELRRLSLKTAPYRRAITFQPGRMPASQPEHGAIFVAILAGDATTASDQMRKHINLLSSGIADFLSYVRLTDQQKLFKEAL